MRWSFIWWGVHKYGMTPPRLVKILKENNLA